MVPPSKTLSQDFSAISSLIIDGVIGVTEIVEAMHLTLNGYAWPTGSVARQQHTSSAAELIYRFIREAGELARHEIDKLHFRPNSNPQSKPHSLLRETALATLNGVLGDHLAARSNPLAIPLQWRRNGVPWEPQALATALADVNGKVAIMLHGSCNNDLQWQQGEHNHGTALARDFELLPLYLHYNSGLHTSENGRALAALLELLKELSPQPLQISIIAHSMGGLVARSACYYAQQSRHQWLQQLRKIIFIGTPHHGTPLERSGNWVDTLLELSPYSAPLARLGKIRSSGVTDLRYGNVIDEDWQHRDRFLLTGDPRKPVPLPQHVACYAIAATIAKEPNKITDELIGDMLVPLSSALGQHKRAEMALGFAQNRQWIARGLWHKELLGSIDVYAKIKQWLSD